MSLNNAKNVMERRINKERHVNKPKIILIPKKKLNNISFFLLVI